MQHGVLLHAASCAQAVVQAELTLFFSTRPAVWYRTGPAKCTTTKLGSWLSLLWPKQGLPARALSMRVWSWAALLGRFRRHSCGLEVGSQSQKREGFTTLIVPTVWQQSCHTGIIVTPRERIEGSANPLGRWGDRGKKRAQNS